MISPRVLASGGGSSAYNSHPNPLFDKDGNLVVAYYRGSTHGYSNDGAVYSKVSTDGGATFGPEVLICDHVSGYDTRNIALSYDPVSHTFTAFFRTYDAGDSIVEGVHHEVWYCQSTDGGSTWGAPVNISSLFSGWPVEFVVPFGVGIQTTNGIMQTFVGRHRSTGRSICGVLFSTDGVNWGSLTTVWDMVTSTAKFTEPYAVRVDDDRLVILVRNYANGYENKFYACKSSDGGLNWTTPTDNHAFWTNLTPDASSPLCAYRISPTEIACAWGARGESGAGYLYVQKVGVEAFFARPELGWQIGEPRQKLYVSKVTPENEAHWSEFAYPQIVGDGNGSNFIAWYDSHDGTDRVSTDCWISSL